VELSSSKGEVAKVPLLPGDSSDVAPLEYPSSSDSNEADDGSRPAVLYVEPPTSLALPG
jgi:hypothetical protein